MNRRKLLYGLLLSPLLVAALYFAVVPRVTRQAFLAEFSHRFAGLFGFAEESSARPPGLRQDHPEEYGPQATSAEETAAPEEVPAAE